MSGTPARIAMAHNYYQERGGEDLAFENEVELLRSHGHDVATYIRHNAELENMGTFPAATSTFWSSRSHAELVKLIDQFRPEVVHFHNTFPLISPSGYYAAQSRGLPVIQTLHNYRLTCPVATHFRAGGACEDCLGRTVAWPAVLHACYRDSRLLNAVVAGMLAGHKVVGTFAKKVAAYIVLSEFMKDKLVEGGIDPNQIKVKPNSVLDPGRAVGERDRALFVGRLSEEKGLFTLLKAWRGLADIPLDIVGAGPLEARLRSEVDDSGLGSVTITGYLDHGRSIERMKRARYLIAPSLSYEGLPTVVLEAFACGTPVIVSDHGALREMVRDGIEGLTFPPGNWQRLSTLARSLWESDSARCRLARGARQAYLDRYTPESNYEQLVAIYRASMSTNQTGTVRSQNAR